MLLIIDLLQTALLAMGLELLCVAGQSSKAGLSVESTVDGAELPNRVRGKFVACRMHILLDSLVVGAFAEGHPADHSVG